MMKPREIERIVYDLEEIRISIQAPDNVQMGDFCFQRKAASSSSITEWLQQRIIPLISGYGVAVFDGTGAIPHGRTKLETLRASYAK